MENISDSTENFSPTPEELSQLAELAALICDLARQGETEHLLAYISAGIPVDFADSTGNTLLMLAAYNEQPETVAALLTQGADPNVLNARGQSPLSGAVFKGEQEIARLLIQAGADLRLGTPDAIATADFFDKREQFDPIFALAVEATDIVTYEIN